MASLQGEWEHFGFLSERGDCGWEVVEERADMDDTGEGLGDLLELCI